MERNVAAKVFSKTCRMFINTFRDDQVKKEVALEIFSISMTIHENFISSAAPGEPIGKIHEWQPMIKRTILTTLQTLSDESAFPLIHVLSALSIQYGPLSHNFSSSNSSKRSAWSFMLLRYLSTTLSPLMALQLSNLCMNVYAHFLYVAKDRIY